MLGQTISHYRIVEMIGKGGMGVIYKAHDTKLDREVALKFLPADISSDPNEVTRFNHEAKAISHLNHSHIATIYDLDEVNGQWFIALEHISGGTLKQKIKKEKLTITQVIEYAIQIAEGLAHAHNHDVIHRDLKSDNIMLTENGELKIMDFGLAKLSGASKLTKTGSTVGTAAYMSPEQARGEDSDQRSDLFSLGIVLYEITSGTLPFQGEHEMAILYEIVNVPHKPLTETDNGIPVEFSVIIDRLLEKDPNMRYQRAEELLNDLQILKELKSRNEVSYQRKRRKLKKIIRNAITALLTVAVIIFVLVMIFTPPKTTPKEAKSIAVLPLRNLSTDKEQEYFSDGITEDIINHLAKIAELKVISRTSSMQYKNSNKNIKEIAAELNVSNILEGSVRKFGNQIRIVTNLIDAKTEQTLWGETYDKEVAQIFAIQTDVAQSISGALAVRLTTEEKNRIHREPTKDNEAYRLYLEARHIRKLYRGIADIRKSIFLLEQSLSRDPQNAEAWAELSFSQGDLAANSDINIDSCYSEAAQSANRALSLDEGCVTAYIALGFIKRNYEFDWLGAERMFKKALDLEPGNSLALLYTAIIASTLGDQEKAIKTGWRAVEADPLNHTSYTRLANMLLYADKLDESYAVYRKVLDLNPSRLFIHFALGRILLLQGKIDSAMAEIQKENNPMFHMQGLCLLHHAKGNKGEAQKSLASFIQQYGGTDAFQVAEIYAYQGMINNAFEWLERAHKQHDSGVSLLLDNPLLKNIVDDPRYPELLDKLKLPYPKDTVKIHTK